MGFDQDARYFLLKGIVSRYSELTFSMCNGAPLTTKGEASSGPKCNRQPGWNEARRGELELAVPVSGALGTVSQINHKATIGYCIQFTY